MIVIRRKPGRLGIKIPREVTCQPHLKWVRGCECAAHLRGPQAHLCSGRIEAHHTPTRGAAGRNHPSVAPLCSYHHSLLDSPGWSEQRFNEVFGINLREIATELWKRSPHRAAWEKKIAST